MLATHWQAAIGCISFSMILGDCISLMRHVCTRFLRLQGVADLPSHVLRDPEAIQEP